MSRNTEVHKFQKYRIVEFLEFQNSLMYGFVQIQEFWMSVTFEILKYLEFLSLLGNDITVLELLRGHVKLNIIPLV